MQGLYSKQINLGGKKFNISITKSCTKLYNQIYEKLNGIVFRIKFVYSISIFCKPNTKYLNY